MESHGNKLTAPQQSGRLIIPFLYTTSSFFVCVCVVIVPIQQQEHTTKIYVDRYVRNLFFSFLLKYSRYQVTTTEKKIYIDIFCI